MLQKVGRSEGGVYTCTAHNSEGDGVSNSMSLDVKCKLNRKLILIYTHLKHTLLNLSNIELNYIPK